MEDREKLALDIADAILDRPIGFSAGHRHFFLWPVTFGKMLLTQRITEQLGIDSHNLQINPFAESLRLVESKKDECLLLITYHTLKTKREVNNTQLVAIRKNLLAQELDNEDIATLLISCLTWDKTGQFMKHLKIDKEIDRMQQVARCKKNKNTYQFGGVSVYGSIIDNACERYGWTFDYVVWEISYANLQLMLKDSVKSIYLTDDEAKRCHVPINGDSIDGNNAEVMADVISGSDWT
ncbi:MAG: hypothetical protein IJ640_08525 [Prevotella sp.]|nr:hypothetical protein [Prevotella sp.]